MNTKIEWTDATWNPVTGCTKVSTGCKNCYAERITERFGHKFTDIYLYPRRLSAPLHWRKPRRVFVNSMSDLFHEAIPDLFIDQVFAVMALAQSHTFQILTKRPTRMRQYFGAIPMTRRDRVIEAMCKLRPELPPRHWYHTPLNSPHWPLPNVWLGVSCEDQERADERIPLLLQTPAAVRFVSAEPLLGPVEFDRAQGWWLGPPTQKHGMRQGLDWIIVGGESGPGARPMDLVWARSIVEQCKEADVPCFVKQLGARPFDTDYEGALRRDKVISIVSKRAPITQGFTHVRRMETDGCESDLGLYRYHRLHDHKGGDPSEWPEDLRVREYP